MIRPCVDNRLSSTWAVDSQDPQVGCSLGRLCISDALGSTVGSGYMQLMAGHAPAAVLDGQPAVDEARQGQHRMRKGGTTAARAE